MILFWVAILAVSILLYVLLDGFDLGVGILFGATRKEGARRTMMSAVAPVWDGHETWLVVAGVVLWGAFPLAYSILLSAFYLPLLLMLAGLILRGVAFEYRARTERMRWIWDTSFAGGSLAATFIQGLMVGALVEGLPISDGRYVGGMFGWVSPFAALCGIGLGVGYTLLGACWLVRKCEGEVRDVAYRQIPGRVDSDVRCNPVDSIGSSTESRVSHSERRLLLGFQGTKTARREGKSSLFSDAGCCTSRQNSGSALGLLVFLVVVFAYALARNIQVMDLWLERPYLVVFPLIGIVAALAAAWSVRRRRDGVPFLMVALIFLTAFGTLAFSFWPYMIPFSITINEAASPHASLAFMFWGAGLFVFPLMLGYTAVSLSVFRGKVASASEYH